MVAGGICSSANGAPQTITDSGRRFGYTPGPSDFFGGNTSAGVRWDDARRRRQLTRCRSGASVFALTGSGTTWSGVQPVAPGGGTTGYAQYLGLSSSGTTAIVAGFPSGGSPTDWVFSQTGQSWFQMGNPILPPVTNVTNVAVDGTTVVAGGDFMAYVYP